MLLPVVPGRDGGETLRGGRTYKPKKDFAYRMHAGRPASVIPIDSQAEFWCAQTFRLVVVWWLILFHGGDVWCHVVGFQVTSGLAMWLVTRCHVMWCYVMWCDSMWCNGMEWHVRRPFQCAVQPWDARHKKTTESPCHTTTTRYYKVLLRLRCYSVLRRATKYYSSTTP